MADGRSTGYMAGQETRFAWVPFAIYAVLLGLGLLVGHFIGPKTLLAVVVIGLAASMYMWITSYRVKHAILDVPTSKVRSAAQGYVELCGKVEILNGKTVTGPLTKIPCVWYAYNVTERNGDQEEGIESDSASVSFLLRDETGTCHLNPREASVMCDKIVLRGDGNRQYREWSMREGDSIYAIGLFRTVAVQENDVGKEALVAQGGKHRLVAPRDGRSYIISNLPHDKLAEFFGLLNLVHVGAFFSALAVLLAILLHLAPV